MSARSFTSRGDQRSNGNGFLPGNFTEEVKKVMTLAEQWASREGRVGTLPPPPTPYSGRSVPVLKQDLNFAFTRLRRILDRNNVQRELRLTERHEKKGYKRRRLASERWRRRFAHEVRKKVQLVNEIRARGA